MLARPIINNQDMVRFVKEPARDIPVKDEVDILVVGGGPSGIMAGLQPVKG